MSCRCSIFLANVAHSCCVVQESAYNETMRALQSA